MRSRPLAVVAAVLVATTAGALAPAAAADGDLLHLSEAWAVTRGSGALVGVVDAGGGDVSATVLAGAPDATVNPFADVTDASAAGASVILVSTDEAGLGGLLRESPALADAIDAAVDAGAVVVAGAGVDGDRAAPPPPATAAVTVARVRDTGQPVPFANVSDPRSVAAPGASSAVAAANVAAVAALLAAQGRSPDAVVVALTETAANPLGDARVGGGVVDAAAAVAVPLPVVGADAAAATVTERAAAEPSTDRRPSVPSVPVPDPTDRPLVPLAAIAVAFLLLDTALATYVVRARA
jgi:hypothetical protein